MSQAGVIYTIVVVAICILDWLGCLLHWPFMYSYGVPVYRHVEPALGGSAVAGSGLPSSLGAELRVLPPGRMLVRDRFWPPHAKTDVRISIEWRPSGAVVQARQPLLVILGSTTAVALMVDSGFWRSLDALLLASIYVVLCVSFVRASRRRALAIVEALTASADAARQHA